jgi:hypothetical protein
MSDRELRAHYPKFAEAIRDIDAIARVQCGDKDHEEEHTIVITRSGRMVLLNHPPREKLVDEMRVKANLPPEHACAKIMRDFVGNGSSYYRDIPEGLVHAHKQVDQRRCERQKYKDAEALQRRQLEMPLRERYATLVNAAAARSIDGRLAYRKSKRHHYVEVKISAKDLPSRLVVITGHRHSDRVNSTTATFHVRLSWYTRVFKQGFAVVDGLLVLDVIKANPLGGYRVIAARQAKDYEVLPAEATVYKNSDGKWTLMWDLSTRAWNAACSNETDAENPGRHS